MCGIAGILDPRGVDRAEIDRMVAALAHRGPDDVGVHVEEGIGLGFRRLSIIDLETGNQPIASEDGSVRVVCNGELYEHRVLRRGLEARGHRFATRSDVEVLVHLYEEHGEDLVRELRGMFAFAVWDGRRRRLVLGRDHLGQKPLYWARDGERVWFASEIKGILAVAPRFRRLDPCALDEYLALRIVSEPRSMFAGVRKLPPGHVLTLEDGTGDPVPRRYWNLEFEPKRPARGAEALEALDAAIRESVRVHLESDVPVGAFLSGGIDSGLITAFMTAESGVPVDTFSVGVPYGDHNEAPAARRMAAQFHTRHHEWTIDGDVVGLLPEVVHHADEPSDPLSVCMYFLAERASPHVKVVLGGDGGDELFGGYDRYVGVPLVRYYAALPPALRKHATKMMLRLAPSGAWYKSLSHRIRWLHELAGAEGGRRYARSLGYFYFTAQRREALYTDSFRRRLSGFDAEESVAYWHDTERVKEGLDRMLLADLMVRLPNHSVMILDRMTMAHGLEARSPLLDHRMAEFAATLPARQKVNGRDRRWLEMRLAERYLPPEIVRRPKQGFSSALPYLLRGRFEALFGRFLTDSRLVEAGLLRPQPIHEMLNAHLSGSADHGNRLWLLLNAELWHRMHLEGAGVDTMRSEVDEALGGPGGRRPSELSGPLTSAHEPYPQRERTQDSHLDEHDPQVVP